MILPYRDKQPLIEESAYVSSNATVIGDVTLEKGSSEMCIRDRYMHDA